MILGETLAAAALIAGVPAMDDLPERLVNNPPEVVAVAEIPPAVLPKVLRIIGIEFWWGDPAE